MLRTNGNVNRSAANGNKGGKFLRVENNWTYCWIDTNEIYKRNPNDFHLANRSQTNGIPLGCRNWA